jgi:hypothetical protein
MTLHRVVERRSMDELDNLIRKSMTESVADASPPTDTWERIHARAERSVIWERVGSLFRGAYRATAAQTSQVSGFFLALIVAWIWPRGRWDDWRFDPSRSRLLLEQYGFFTLLRLAF